MISVTEAEIDRECEQTGLGRVQAYRRIKARKTILAENRHRAIPLVSAQVIDITELPEFRLAQEHARKLRLVEGGRG